MVAFFSRVPGDEEASKCRWAKQFDTPPLRDAMAAQHIDLDNLIFSQGHDVNYIVCAPTRASLVARGVLEPREEEGGESEGNRAPKDRRYSTVPGGPMTSDRMKLGAYAREVATVLGIPGHSQPTGTASLYDASDLVDATEALRPLSQEEEEGIALAALEKANPSPGGAQSPRGPDLCSGYVALVGDALQTPYWPDGMGVNKGFLSGLDLAWVIRKYTMVGTNEGAFVTTPTDWLGVAYKGEDGRGDVLDPPSPREVLGMRHVLYDAQRNIKAFDTHVLNTEAETDWKIDPSTRYTKEAYDPHNSYEHDAEPWSVETDNVDDDEGGEERGEEGGESKSVESKQVGSKANADPLPSKTPEGKGDAGSSEALSTVVLKKLPVVGERRLQMRVTLVNLYTQHNPTKINTIDHIMSQYDRHEDEMFKTLYEKYGIAGEPPKFQEGAHEVTLKKFCGGTLFGNKWQDRVVSFDPQQDGGNGELRYHAPEKVSKSAAVRVRSIRRVNMVTDAWHEKNAPKFLKHRLFSVEFEGGTRAKSSDTPTKSRIGFTSTDPESLVFLCSSGQECGGWMALITAAMENIQTRLMLKPGQKEVYSTRAHAQSVAQQAGGTEKKGNEALVAVTPTKKPAGLTSKQQRRKTSHAISQLYGRGRGSSKQHGPGARLAALNVGGSASLVGLRSASRSHIAAYDTGGVDDAAAKMRSQENHREFSMAALRAVFDSIDAHHHGTISVRDLIIALRRDEEVAKFMHLPMHIHQEDGSRDTFERRFQVRPRAERSPVHGVHGEHRVVVFTCTVGKVVAWHHDDQPPCVFMGLNLEVA
jgi:hypothetical protein